VPTARPDAGSPAPVLLLWSGTGPLGSWYADDGGPLEPWRELGRNVTGHPVDGGDSFPEEHPRDMTEALAAFFAPEGD
jgi:haloacetate dehalogenase